MIVLFMVQYRQRLAASSYQPCVLSLVFSGSKVVLESIHGRSQYLFGIDTRASGEIDQIEHHTTEYEANLVDIGVERSQRFGDTSN
jgi:hypothetical protein